METLGISHPSVQSFLWQWLWWEADKCSWTDTSENTKHEMEISSPAFLSLVLLLTFIEHLLHSRCSAVNRGCKTAPHGSYPWDHGLESCINFWSLPARWQVLDRKRCIQHSRRELCGDPTCSSLPSHKYKPREGLLWYAGKGRALAGWLFTFTQVSCLLIRDEQTGKR